MIVSCAGASRLRLDGGRTLPLPAASSALFLYVVTGEIAVPLPHGGQIAARGDLLHFSRGSEGLIATRPGRPVELLAVQFDATISGSIDVAELLDLPAVLPVGPASRVHHYLAEAADMAPAAVGRSHSLRSLLTLVLLTLVCDHLPEAGRLLRRPRVVQMRRLLPAVRLLRCDMSAASSVDVLAQRCGLSVAQFRRLFHGVFERSPTQYIQQMRVREACRLLHCTDRTVNEICLQIGYEQPSHFHKTFKKFTGVTPRLYREEFEPQRRAG